MPCSEYDLQGLHAGIYFAREANGRLGECQCLSPTFRSSNSFCVALIMLARIHFLFLPGDPVNEALDQRPAKLTQLPRSCFSFTISCHTERTSQAMLSLHSLIILDMLSYHSAKHVQGLSRWYLSSYFIYSSLRERSQGR